MNEIIIGRPINGTGLNDLEYVTDENGDILKFPTKEHAEKFLKNHGATSDDIYYMHFVYTNESRECKCHICEKKDDCYMYGKFQRLPAEITKGLGLGLCPKLNKEDV